MKKEAIFYTDWLVLPKNDFRILIMLAEYGGKFSGTLSDIMVLDHHYGAILRKRVSEKVDDEHFITLGQMIQASAFW